MLSGGIRRLLGGVVWSSLVSRGLVSTLKHVSLVVSFANAAPDLGKTCFLYYVLLRLLCEQQPVALQVNKRFILFQDTGVSLGDYDYEASLPHGTWCLSNSRPHFEQPCVAFLSATVSLDSYVVQTTSPSNSRWSEWHEEYGALVHWMEVITLDELMALG
jgi:hypothetical protein